ncbi:hypothetical protein BSNK01_06340 [Bacillaceae bacterium]
MRSLWIFLIGVHLAVTGCSAGERSDEAKRNISSRTEYHGEYAKKEKATVEDEKLANEPNGNVDGGRQRPQNKSKVLLDVPLIAQKPELKFGCEVTSLAMVLQYAGVRVGKMELAENLPKDGDPVAKTHTGDITHWGNPAHGFVGDVKGQNMGYAVYDRPLQKLMEHYLPGRSLNLTGQPFDQLLQQVREGKPVVVWTTGDFQLPLDLHAVVLVGFDENFVYVNDPLAGQKARKVAKRPFISSWKAMGKQALSYR